MKVFFLGHRLTGSIWVHFSFVFMSSTSIRTVIFDLSLQRLVDGTNSFVLIFFFSNTPLLMYTAH